jgi:hypothetical protein
MGKDRRNYWFLEECEAKVGKRMQKEMELNVNYCKTS